MPTGEFTGFPRETLDFLEQLKANNDREWFSGHKNAYASAVKKPATALAEIVAGELERLTGQPHRPKLFRINRDLRFSKDKTPYHTHIHISWLPVEEGDGFPVWMFGLSPEYCTVGCGVFEFPRNVLDIYRKKIAAELGDDLGRMLDRLRHDGFRIGEPALKRVPAGFPDDHPYVELALHKGIVAWRDLEGPEAATQPDLVSRCVTEFAKLVPLWRFLRELR
ncbi:TIGR02453 family protein [Oricola cellulosilytica]|nr:TIGR02453 family protein [Oricola cellulosilytica]